jgi:PKD repeat protein
MKAAITHAFIVVAAALAASCTMKNQEAPPLTGPSEFGTALAVSVSPDVLQQDGASQSLITVQASGPNGEPLPNLRLTAEMGVNGTIMDFGALSARSIVTNAAGKATMVYTAPVNTGVETLVDIAVTPVGTSYGNHVARVATIRLVPPGIRVPPLNLTPSFTFTPTTPSQGQEVVFDAQASSGAIVEYRWEFGDGSTASGAITSHAFDDLGNYIVRLTLVDAAGRTMSLSRSLTVGQSTAPVAEFVFSPTNPAPNDDVHFNANASSPSAGRKIVSYAWDFGDGGTATGVQPTHRYTQARTYNVTLTVTDDLGRTSVVTKPVDVGVPDDDGGNSPN